MLWMKGWLETRWRFVWMLGFALVTLLLGVQGDGIQTMEHARTLANLQWVVSIVAAIQLAGAGIRTQSPFRAKAGLHGSTQYTLSMPVSRSRLLAVRALVGFVETAGIVAFMIVCTWTLFPLIRGNSTLADLVKLLLASVTCVLCFYLVSLTIATVWDELWQIYGSLFLTGISWMASMNMPVPPSANVFRFSTDASPLVTHTLPWPAMVVSLVISAVLFLIAVAAVNSYEY
jgi:hypothetical protein